MKIISQNLFDFDVYKNSCQTLELIYLYFLISFGWFPSVSVSGVGVDFENKGPPSLFHKYILKNYSEH